MKLIISLGIIFSLTACALPVFEPARTFRFELEGIANSRPFSFQQHYSCYQTAVLSTADGKYHKQWSASGSGTQVGQVGDGLFIIYKASGCDPNAHKKSVIAAVDSVDDPKVLHLFRVLPTEPLITITKDRLVPIQANNLSLGPPPDQVRLKETLRENQTGFQRVKARIIPYDIFATSDQTKAYFDNLKGIEIAAESDQVPERRVFPFFSQRNFAKLRNNGEYKKEAALSFNGEEFTFENALVPPSDIFYSTPETRGSKSPWVEPLAWVRYKNVRFSVRQLQEIYDSDLRAVIQFYKERRTYPWPSPEDVDIQRLEARKGW